MDPVWGMGLIVAIPLISFILECLKPPYPEVGDTVQVKDTLEETGTVVHVKKNGFGYYEGFATCSVRFANGWILDYKENELKIMPQLKKQEKAQA